MLIHFLKKELGGLIDLSTLYSSYLCSLHSTKRKCQLS